MSRQNDESRDAATNKMEEFSKEGRKLRPRKSQSAIAAHSEKVEFTPGGSRSEGARRSFGAYGHKSENDGERREGRSFGGPRRSGGFGRSHEEGGSRPGRSFGAGRSAGPRRSFSGHSNEEGGERREGRSFGGPRRSGGFGRTHEEGGSRPGRSFGAGRSAGEFGERRSFGRKPSGRKPFEKKASYFDKNSDEGINRMIGRRSAIDESKVSGNDYTPEMIKDEVRLNKFIANSGVCSRREADTLIQAGVVTVNGEVVTELGVKVNIYKDDIRFNGERLKGEEKVYLVMNKPKGFVTTASDPHADKTVIDLIKGCDYRVYPVGRLDKNTTGVLMLTNDGEIAERLTHPSYDKKKIYQVFVDKAVSEEDYNKILSGVELSDGEVKADSLEYIDEGDKRKLGIEIHSGKNRIVRRIFESLGYNVIALDRVYFAGLTKKGLKKGEWRYLTEGEVNILKMGAYV